MARPGSRISEDIGGGWDGDARAMGDVCYCISLLLAVFISCNDKFKIDSDDVHQVMLLSKIL